MPEPTWASEDGQVQLYLGDCLSVLPTLAAGSVDAVVTDPPYGIGVCNRSDGGGVCSAASGNKVYGRSLWDKQPADARAIAAILETNVPTIIWGGNYFTLPPSSGWLVWDKGQRNFSLADVELAWTNQQRAARVFLCTRGQMAAEHREHPTQKPLSLMVWCLKWLCLSDGATVLDPFFGSCTTGVACVQTGRRFIGIEIEEKYFAIAVKRIQEAKMQLRMELP